MATVGDSSTPTAAPPADPAGRRSSTPAAAPPTSGDASRTGRHFLLFQAVPAWFISMLLHMLLLLILALLTITESKSVQNILTVANVSNPEPDMEQFTLTESDPGVIETADSNAFEELVPAPPKIEELDPLPIEQPMPLLTITSGAANISDMVAPSHQLLQSISAEMTKDLSSRSGDMKKLLMKRYGGTEASEAAVAKALQWLALHQLPNGAWTFNHTLVCRGLDGCDGAGEMKFAPAVNAATALGVLPFLGAGQTHTQGTYQQNVRGALRFLIQNGKRRQLGGLDCLDLTEAGGTMYSHGLASIALCEAYAMTQDPMLLIPAQQSLNYIIWSQDRGGGWRYGPQQPGDTSVTGWQVMALKSGDLGHLVVPPRTVLGASYFLDSVATPDGSQYHYMPGQEGGHTPCIPIGLLCRMYLGVDKLHPSLQKGVAYLAEKGVNKNDIYYNYYAAQVLRHNGGAPWEAFNNELRDWLVAAQVQEGHAQGSWHWPKSVSHRGPLEGGRLCSTALATMILEVYYRHMPLYADAAAEDDFEL